MGGTEAPKINQGPIDQGSIGAAFTMPRTTEGLISLVHERGIEIPGVVGSKGWEKKARGMLAEQFRGTQPNGISHPPNGEVVIPLQDTESVDLTKPGDFHHDYLPVDLRPVGGFRHQATEETVTNPFGSALRGMRFDLLNHAGSVDVPRRELREDLNEVVAESMQDIEPRSKELYQVKKLAPEVVRAIVDSPDIHGISQEYAGDIIRFAVEAGRNPGLIRRTVIRTGFGGTQDRELVARFPAYLLPALDLREKLIQAQIDADIDPEMVESPDVEFFFAPNAFIYVNGHDRDRVLQNATRMEEVSRAFIRRFFPHAEKSVSYRVDRPMDNGHLDPMSKIVFDYLANVVRTSDQPDVQKIVRELEKFGYTRGGEQGQSMAAHYGALHAPLFQDMLDLPPANLIDRDTDHIVNITIGGRPERLFNRIRQEASTRANRQGFLEFAQKQRAQGLLTDELFEKIVRWKKMIDQKDHLLKQRMYDVELPPEHLPMLTLPLQGGIGEYPVYYDTEFDTPMFSGENPFVHVKNGEEDPSPEMRNMRQEVGKDISRLVKATGGIVPLQEFYRSLYTA